MARQNTHTDPEIILFERELARRNYLEYVRYVFKYIYERPFIESWYYGLIAEVMVDYMNGVIPLLGISFPPTHSKTETCVKCPISFKMGHDQKYSSMYVSYGDALSTETSLGIQDVMRHPAYKALFPKVQLGKEKDTHWSIKGGGGLFATTPTSATTGFHVKNIVIDDPQKAIEANVESSLKKVIDFWDTTIQSRLDEWGNEDKGSIMVVMQRLNKKDLIGHLLETRKDMTYICLEAYIKQPKIYTYGTFSYSRPANEPLHPKYTIEDLKDMETRMPAVFQTQYLQTPKKEEGGFFNIDQDVHFIPDRDIPDQEIFIIVDNAESMHKKADNRAISALGLSLDVETQRELFVVHDLSFGIYDEDKTMEEIIRFMIKFEADVYIENKAAGITLARLLTKKINEENAKLRKEGKPLIQNEVHTYSPKRSVSKERKIMAGKNYTRTGYFRVSTACDKLGVEQLKKELKEFDPDSTTNDDNILDVTVGSTTADFLEAKENGTIPKKQPKNEEQRQKKHAKKTWRV